MLADESRSLIGWREGFIFQRLNPLEHQDWDGFLLANDISGFFHSSAWARVLVDSYAHVPCYFIVREPTGFDSDSRANQDSLSSSSLRALLPMMEVDSRLTGRRGVSLPFTDHCEPWSDSSCRWQDLWSQAVAYGKSRRWKHLEIRGPDAPPAPEAKPSLQFYTHRLDLSQPLDALKSRCESSVRRAVAKALKAGLQVEIADSLDAVRAYYRLHCLTRKKHGLPPQPLKFFEKIHHHVLEGGHGTVILARHQGDPVAGAVYFHQHGQVLYKFGASDESRLDLRGNNLVMWTAIEHFARRQFRSLDFGRTSLAHDGLRRFKLGWGAAETRIQYFKYSLRHDSFIQETDRVSGWHNHLFRLLPLPLLRWAGELLYPHLA